MKRRGLSTVIAIAIIIVLSLAGTFILYYNFKKTTVEFGDEVSCFDISSISQSFFIKKACYLNQEEILVEVERKSDALDILSLKFAFYSKENITRWQITGKKCSDVRIYNLERYGGYCNLPTQDSIVRYVFNVSDLDEQEKVKLVLNYDNDGRELSCLIDQKNIEDNC